MPALASTDEDRVGEKIYRQKCASCHGISGEGDDEEYPRQLAGDKSVPQLVRLISKTMPSDAPGTCTGPDAEKVAAYIYDAFYSKAARERNKPPRIELSRLTVSQYRNAVSDLVGSFRGDAQWGDQRGLEGEYFKSKRFRGGDRVIARIDPEVRFDFKTSSPAPATFDPKEFASRPRATLLGPRALALANIPVKPARIDPKEFAIRWQGSVLAPETGEYEFIVRTENSAELWVNDTKRALIDASVKSGSDTEHRGTIRLLGGRAYPIRLVYSKAKQGVEDSKEDKAKAKILPGSVSLEWKMPHRPAEVIPSRNLSPTKFPELFVLETPFPPDDRSIGYERGTSVSKAWDQASTDAAIEVTGYVATHLPELAGARDDAPDRAAKLREFALRFAERAFRRPLDEEQKRLVDRQFAETKDPEIALKRVVLLTLKSPRFLYREVGTGKPDAFDVASRLSFGLWDSLPDRTLLDAAASGRLAARDRVSAQAERMVGDLRSRAKVREFLLQWLKVDQSPDIAKDPKEFSGFEPAVISDLRTSLELSLEDVVWGESSDFRGLLLGEDVYLNGRLAGFYGIKIPPDAPFQKLKLDPGARAGVLTHPYLLACFAYTNSSSPIHRGVFIARSVLGRSLRPPPEAVAPLAPDLHAGLNTRERVALQTSPAACVTCHGMINPLGFGLEQFDAVGRLRSMEKSKPIDASGTFEARSGELVKFDGARELAGVLATSDETHNAFVEQLFHHLVKQPVRAYGLRALPDLKRSFVERKFHVRRLLVDIMATSALAATDAKNP
jgi:hypothetical protein